jgi:hypothetical protein
MYTVVYIKSARSFLISDADRIIRVCNVFATLGLLSSETGHRNKQVMGFNGIANHHVKAKAEISDCAKKLEFN